MHYVIFVDLCVVLCVVLWYVAICVVGYALYVVWCWCLLCYMLCMLYYIWCMLIYNVWYIIYAGCCLFCVVFCATFVVWLLVSVVRRVMRVMFVYCVLRDVCWLLCIM